METVIFNTALIRRRLRDPAIFEIKTVGKRSKTDVVIAYLDDLADKNLLNEIQTKIDIDVGALVMAEKTLEELLIKNTGTILCLRLSLQNVLTWSLHTLWRVI